MKNLLLGVFILSFSFATAQRKGQGEPEIHKTFDGEYASLESVALVTCENNKKEIAYFYSVDGSPVITDKEPQEVTRIILLPGMHVLKLKFQTKDELPMTVDSFENLEFEAGRSYVVKSEYKPGRGEYPTSTYTARLSMWIIDEIDDTVLAEKVVNGKGDLVAGN